MTTPNKSQHTPGPWKAQGSQIIQADNMEAWQLVVASIPSCVDPKPKADAAAHNISERDANARLIAAAPELLEACKTLVGLVKKFDLTTPDGQVIEGKYLLKIQDADIAIAKAEGRAE